MANNESEQENVQELSKEELNEQLQERRRKLESIREKGNAFPNHFSPEHFAGDIIAHYDEKTKEELEESPIPVTVAGRIMARRLMGKASFTHIQDATGKIQIYVQKQRLEEGVYDDFKGWDLGDIIAVEGVLFKTKTNELSVKADKIQLLTKSLRPLPDKWHGLQNQEAKYRQRYVDLIVNEDTRDTFRRRTKIVQFIRDFLVERRFLEVETPMMHVIPGGATARPFVTHHNTLDMELFLRVAPELYLKRLIVGGLERVFEINRNFRNEGISTKHNPEFTMLEFYQAYATYTDLMDLTEEMLRELTIALTGGTTVSYQGMEIDFGRPFARYTIVDSIVAYNESIDKDELLTISGIHAVFERLDINFDKSWPLGKLQFELFEATVEDKLSEPTFITEYPIEVSPLARRNDEKPHVTDRFELFIASKEVANGFSELNDPDDQAERFRLQVEAKDAGDDEAMHFDADYIRALEHGMPPTAGEGIGIDRLVMLYTDSPSIRDVILFPHMRHKS